MIDGIIHFLKHLIGLCGEPHPSLIIGVVDGRIYTFFKTSNWFVW